MEHEEFRKLAKDVIDYIVEYTANIRERNVLPSVEPGYLHRLIPKEAPKTPDDWKQILPDFEALIMPGITHWNSPMFNAYYPAGNSYPSIIGDILSAGIGCVGINWLTSPACTELEVIVVDWLAKLMSLPECFLASSPGPGGGVIQTSGSEGILMALLVAKEKMSRQVLVNNPSWDEGFVKGKLVAYSSDQSNSAIEKAGLLGSMKTRLLPCDHLGRMTGDLLARAIAEDKANGLIPAFVVATLGTTGICAFDNLFEIGPICHREGIWLHVDAAYAGAAFICPEYRHLMKGIECADSINMNPHKWLLVNFDCSVLWLKDRHHLLDSFSVERIYLRGKENAIEKLAPDFRHWEIPLGRRFRALKLWITLRLYGQQGLEDYIRKQVGLAKQFEAMVKGDQRFELVAPVTMGLVCFRIKGDANLTKELLKSITDKKELYMNQCTFCGKYFLRYAICSRLTEPDDVQNAWRIVTSHTDQVLSRQLSEIIARSGEVKCRTSWDSCIEENIISSRS